MGKSQFRKRSWTLENKRERLKHYQFQRDQRVLREFRHVKKQQNYLEHMPLVDEDELESTLLLPKALIKRHHESDNHTAGSEKRAENFKESESDQESSGSEKPSISLAKEVTELQPIPPVRSQKLSKARAGLAFRFKKELEIAEAKKRERDATAAQKDAKIKAREEFLRERLQTRRIETRLVTRKTKKGQPKMESVITALTSRILELASTTAGSNQCDS